MTLYGCANANLLWYSLLASFLTPSQIDNYSFQDDMLLWNLLAIAFICTIMFQENATVLQARHRKIQQCDFSCTEGTYHPAMKDTGARQAPETLVPGSYMFSLLQLTPFRCFSFSTFHQKRIEFPLLMISRNPSGQSSLSIHGKGQIGSQDWAIDWLLTVRAFFGSSQQQCLGDGCIVGHDGNIQWQKTLTVWGVKIQLLQAKLLEQLLHLIKVLQLNSLKECSIALKLQRGTESYKCKYATHFTVFTTVIR